VTPLGPTCTAWVDDDAPPCGEPTTTERNGEPRCAEHAYEDDCRAWVWDSADVARFLATPERP
jgi:hypothetical protein